MLWGCAVSFAGRRVKAQNLAQGKAKKRAHLWQIKSPLTQVWVLIHVPRMAPESFSAVKNFEAQELASLSQQAQPLHVLQMYAQSLGEEQTPPEEGV